MVLVCFGVAFPMHGQDTDPSDCRIGCRRRVAAAPPKPMHVRETVSSALRALFSPPPQISLPCDSSQLLLHIIQWSLSTSIPNSSRLHLTELPLLEDILQELAEQWECGIIRITTADNGRYGQLVVTDVEVTEPPKKRKRDSSEESRTYPASAT